MGRSKKTPEIELLEMKYSKKLPKIKAKRFIFIPPLSFTMIKGTQQDAKKP